MKHKLIISRKIKFFSSDEGREQLMPLVQYDFRLA